MISNQLFCPCDCHSHLEIKEDGLQCRSCEKFFPKLNGHIDFLEEDRFDDEMCECLWCNEEDTGRHLVENYLHPLLKQLLGNQIDGSGKILSIGCGVGSDVEALLDAGYDAYGIDAGNRSDFWNRRKYPEKYYLANAKNLPFSNESFDVIIMGCVLPHIGVGNDTYLVEDNFLEQRQKAADEMIRVVKKGGHLIVSSPNKLCPLDFFHRATINSHMPRLHMPSERFLLSVDDYKQLFQAGGECKSIEILPIKGYWGFFSSSRYLLGRILQVPVKFYFEHFISWKITKFLRGTSLNPWLILLIKR